MKDAEVINNIRSEELYKKFIWFNGMAVYKNYGYFSADNFNGFFRVNLEDFTTEYLGVFPDEISQQALYFNAINNENKIIFVPATADNIAIYDIKYKKIIMIPIKRENERGRWNNQKYKFFNTVSYKNYVFLISQYYPAIIRLDVDTEEVLYLKKWVEIIERNPIDLKRMYFRRDAEACVVNNKLFLPCCLDNLIVELDMESLQFSYNRIGKAGFTYRCICFDKGLFWIVTWDGKTIIKWNKEKGTCEEFQIYIDKNLTEFFVSSIFIKDDVLWCFPLSKFNYILYFNITKSTWGKVDFFNDVYCSIHPWQHMYSFAFPYGEYIYAYSGASMKLLKIDIKNGKMRDSFIPKGGIKNEYIVNSGIQCGNLYENMTLNLTDFLNSSSLFNTKDLKGELSTNGSKIHQFIIKQVN